MRATILVTALYLVAVALIEPLYVAGGFALYLNRRTALEGWDLEVQLRRIAQRTDRRQDRGTRVASRAAANGSALALVIGCVAALLAMPGSLACAGRWAHQRAPQAPQSPTPPSRRSRPCAAAQPGEATDHGSAQGSSVPTVRDADSDRTAAQDPSRTRRSATTSGFGSFMQFVAEILRGLVWVLLGGVLLYALYWVLRRLNWIRAPGALGMDAAEHAVRAGRAAREPAAGRGGGGGPARARGQPDRGPCPCSIAARSSRCCTATRSSSPAATPKPIA